STRPDAWPAKRCSISNWEAPARSPAAARSGCSTTSILSTARPGPVDRATSCMAMAMSIKRRNIVMSFRNRKRFLKALMAVALLLCGLGAFFRFRPDPHFDRVKELREQLAGEAGRKLPAEERRELGRQMRQEIEQMSPRQRQELFAERRQAQREK